MNQGIVFELGAILIIASLIGIIIKLLRQPIILAYLISGVLIGPFAFGILKDTQFIGQFATIGLIFLLFLVGLELNPRKLLEIGKPALSIAAFQIVVSGFVFFIFAKLFGMGNLGALFFAVAFTFSSTAIIVTLLSNRNDLDSLHGKILVGILLVQDFVALTMLTVFSGISSSLNIPAPTMALTIGIRALILFTLTYLISQFILPAVFHRIAKSQEVLFISSLAWCFLLSIVALSLGFSAEIGAFLAGISLAHLPYSPHIAAKTKTLRDFFIMLFFIYLGTTLVFTDVAKMIVPALILSILVMTVNPLAVTLMMSALGFKKRTSFVTGITLTQISEFSFIVVVLGTKLSILPKELNTFTSLVAIITIFFSTYLITFSNRIYHFLRPYLGFLETKNENGLCHMPKKLNGHIILIGYHRIGSVVLEQLNKMKKDVAVIDVDPKRIAELKNQNISCIFGDAVDHDLVEKLNIKDATMIISTLDKFEENKIILETYRKLNNRLKFVITADSVEDAKDLYGAGAGLVIVPTLISGDYLSYLLRELNSGDLKFEKVRKKELENLEENGDTKSLPKKFTGGQTK